MGAMTKNKRLVIGGLVIGVLVTTFVVSHLLPALAGSQRAKDVASMPGGQSVDPQGKLKSDGSMRFHEWTHPKSKRTYILAQGTADVNDLNRWTAGRGYTRQTGRLFRPGEAGERVRTWCELHEINPGDWNTRFGTRGCYARGKTTAGGSFQIVCDYQTGRFVMRYQLR